MSEIDVVPLDKILTDKVKILIKDKQIQQLKAELKQYKKSKQASYEAMQDKWNKAVLKNRELKAENEDLKELGRNLNALVWYIYCGSEDNLAEDVISEYYNAKNESDDIYLKNFWKKNYSLEQTEYRIKKEKYKATLDEIERLTKIHIQECIDFDDCYRAREQMKIILQLIERTKKGE